jgi:hypothetical protein
MKMLVGEVVLRAANQRGLADRNIFVLRSVLVCVFVMLAQVAMLSGCGEDPGACRYDEVKVGMTMEQVRSILGAPDSIETIDWEPDVDTRWVYMCGFTEVNVEFSGGCVYRVWDFWALF